MDERLGRSGETSVKAVSQKPDPSEQGPLPHRNARLEEIENHQMPSMKMDGHPPAKNHQAMYVKVTGTLR